MPEHILIQYEFEGLPNASIYGCDGYFICRWNGCGITNIRFDSLKKAENFLTKWMLSHINRKLKIAKMELRILQEIQNSLLLKKLEKFEKEFKNEDK